MLQAPYTWTFKGVIIVESNLLNEKNEVLDYNKFSAVNYLLHNLCILN